MPARRPGRPGPTTPPADLSRERIVEVALTLIDSAGEDNFSMRRLAAALGATPMSIYWYFSNKRDLLDAVAERILDEVEIPSLGTLPWRDAATHLMRSLRAQLKAHPHREAVVGTPDRIPPALIRFGNAGLAVARRAGFDGTDAVLAYHALVYYTLGISRTEAAPGNRSGRPIERFIEAIDKLSAGDTEHFSELLPRSVVFDWDELFEFGLARILDGLETMLATTPTRRPQH